MTPTTVLREATTADAERLAAAIADGFETYRAFTPPGWKPPPAAVELAHLRRLLPDAATWCLLAEHDGRVAGQVTFVPAAHAVHPVDDPSLAHLRNLFVDRHHWGSGLASTLHDAAVEAAGERGYRAMRLFTPAAHGRARRFYEREGWVQEGDPYDEPGLGMAVVEYRHALG